MFKEIFKARLKELRQKQKLSQNAMAKILNVTLRSYQYYESNQKAFLPSYNTLIKISEFFNVSIDYLFGYTDNPVRLSK
ncbi:MAG: helix-turn-helix domain-containing protein [Clostridiales bacterium]|nr:helix-turn-helix domain-containing protein [Clostridiales bacterium]